MAAERWMSVFFRDEAAEGYPGFYTLYVLYTVALNGFSGFKSQPTNQPTTWSWRESDGRETKEFWGKELGMDLSKHIFFMCEILKQNIF